MQINASRVFQNAVHLQQPNRHVNEIGFIGVGHRGVNYSVKSRVFRFDEVEPCDVNISERPRIFEFCTRRFRTDRCCVIRFAIERRIQVNQVNRFAIHASHDREICPQ